MYDDDVELVKTPRKAVLIVTAVKPDADLSLEQRPQQQA